MTINRAIEKNAEKPERARKDVEKECEKERKHSPNERTAIQFSEQKKNIHRKVGTKARCFQKNGQRKKLNREGKKVEKQIRRDLTSRSPPLLKRCGKLRNR